MSCISGMGDGSTTIDRKSIENNNMQYYYRQYSLGHCDGSRTVSEKTAVIGRSRPLDVDSCSEFNNVVVGSSKSRLEARLR